jgi:hypothetical protein
MPASQSACSAVSGNLGGMAFALAGASERVVSADTFWTSDRALCMVVHLPGGAIEQRIEHSDPGACDPHGLGGWAGP